MREGPRSATHVRRDKAVIFPSGCKAHPAIAPAGSNRGRHGGDEMHFPKPGQQLTGFRASNYSLERFPKKARKTTDYSRAPARVDGKNWSRRGVLPQT